MKVVRILKENLPRFTELVGNKWEVWGPVRAEGRNVSEPETTPESRIAALTQSHVYRKVRSFSELELTATRTIIPSKTFFHPPHFNMFKFSLHGYSEELGNIPSRVVFGLHPCDIHALLILDKLFTREFPDPYWIARRDKTIVIGHSCVPDDKCFCHSTGTHVVEEGFDLFFTDLGDFCLVWIGSSKGDDLVRLNPDLFEENVELADIKKFIEWQKWRDTQFKLDIDFTALPDIMELRHNDPIWEEIALSCLSCGSCSMVCPTCNCYNVSDCFYIYNDEGERTRFWDSCMLKEYSLVAGGHNFREKQADRLKLWYTHKLQAFISAFGKFSCVGCGRCIDTCPVEINVKTVARTLRGEPVEAFWKRLALKGAK